VRRGDEDIPIFQMHVAEGNGAVASTRGRSTGHTVTGTLALNTVDGSADGGRQTGGLPFSYSRDFGSRSSSQGTSYTPTTGRLTQGQRDYREYTADMLWHIEVVAYNKNMFGTFGTETAHSLVEVTDGITFLRLSTEVPDPAPVLAGRCSPWCRSIRCPCCGPGCPAWPRPPHRRPVGLRWKYRPCRLSPAAPCGYPSFR